MRDYAIITLVQPTHHQGDLDMVHLELYGAHVYRLSHHVWHFLNIQVCWKNLI